MKVNSFLLGPQNSVKKSINRYAFIRFFKPEVAQNEDRQSNRQKGKGITEYFKNSCSINYKFHSFIV